MTRSSPKNVDSSRLLAQTIRAMVNGTELDDLEQRVENILDGVAAATRGEYDVRIPVVERDDMLIDVEVAVNMLIDELALSKTENETQRREIQAQALRLAERDRALVRALSTPIIVVWPGVIALPLIGRVDEERQSAIAEILLARVATDGATHVILDVTGVSDADASMANALVATARAVGLLGARTLITGVTSALAQAIVNLDLHVDVPTMARLSDALAWVFRDKQPHTRLTRFSGAKTR